MNFLYDPVNAARLTAFVQYISPVKGVQDELVNMGGDNAKLAEDPLLFPDTATFGRLQSWGALAEEEEAKFDEAFASVTGA
jgi:spermidine/putrescine transport system substrate-binding protein